MSNVKESVVWYDLETTGLDYLIHGVIEVALLLEKNGEIVDKYVTKVNCNTYSRDVGVNKKALEINKTELKDIYTFPPVQEVVKVIEQKMYKYYGKKKVKLVGFNNTSFDKWFFEEMFLQANVDGIKYDKLFHYKQIDIFEMIKYVHYIGLLPKTFNQRLVTLIEAYNLASVSEIEEHAHDALWDIELTRRLSDYITSQLKG